MVHVNFYLNKQKKNKHGEHPIYLFFNLTGQSRIRISTSLNVNPNLWSAKNQRFRNAHKNATELNSLLDIYKKRASGYGYNLLDENTESSKQDLIQAIKGTKKKVSSFWEFYNNQIDIFRNSMARGTFSSHLSTYNYLKEYHIQNENLKWMSFGIGFDKRFREFIYSNGKVKKENSIGKHIKNLKSILNSAKLNGLIKDEFFRTYKVYQEKSPKPSLNEEEIKALWDSIELYSGTKKHSLLSLLFMCETSIRIGEAQRLKKIDIHFNEDYFDVHEEKNDAYKKVILTTRAIDILKYFEPLTEEFALIVPTKINIHLKQIAEEIGLNRQVNTKSKVKVGFSQETRSISELISAHIGRITYVTENLKNNIPEEVVRANTGHKDNRQLVRYSRMSLEQRKEAIKKAGSFTQD